MLMHCGCINRYSPESKKAGISFHM